MDELGSGVRNMYKYNKIYSGTDPTFIEGDIFKTIIPLTMQNNMQATMKAKEEISQLLEFCKIPKSRQEMQGFMKLRNKEHFRKHVISPIIKGGLLKLTIPDKPTSPNQKYHYDRR